MQKAKLDLILQEIYSWNPKLKNKEAELIKLIELMAQSKPDTKFDESFAESLKKDLLSHRILLDSDDGLKENNFLFNLKNMNKKIYIITGSFALVSVVVLAVMVSMLPENKMVALINPITNNSKTQFVKANPGAFGSLTSLSSTGSAKGNASTEIMSGSASVSAPVAAVTSDSRMALSAVEPIGLGGGGGVASSKMIVMPQYSYTYAYKGEPLDLTEANGVVYRRLKGDGNLNSNLDSLISTKSFGPINLKAFSNLRAGSISLMEDKRLGLNINIDFNEENIYIGQNWLQWKSDRDNCGDNQACWDSYRIRINDIPEDASLVKMASDFLKEKGINLEHYGNPSIDNNWRLNYESSTDKENYYIPEEMSVIYPLVLNEQTVYDQSGNLDGLRVSVNLLQKAVSGVNNLTSYRYETSDYALETDSTKILALAEKGGYGSGMYYFGDTQEKITLELGTPIKSLIHFYRYTNNVNEELFIPALIFPINNAPANYYGTRSITVPLVQEMINDLNNNGGGYGGGIMPMVR